MMRRLCFSFLAFFVCHFSLYIAFAAITTNTPKTLIALIDFCVVMVVFSMARGKKESPQAKKQNNKKTPHEEPSTNPISTNTPEGINTKKNRSMIVGFRRIGIVVSCVLLVIWWTVFMVWLEDKFEVTDGIIVLSLGVLAAFCTPWIIIRLAYWISDGFKQQP